MSLSEHNQPFVVALREHDSRIEAAGFEIWIGAEPTFTDRFSSAPEWNGIALGAEKEKRARRLTARLAASRPGGILLRTLGRQYPGESQRRWSYGLLCRRDGNPIWTGPADPLSGGGPANDETFVRFLAHLIDSMAAAGWRGFRFPGKQAGEQRILFRTDGAAPRPSLRDDTRVLRPSLHAPDQERADLVDSLSREGFYLLILTLVEEDGQHFASIELPYVRESQELLQLLDLIGAGANRAGLKGLIVRGYPPVADERLCWTTVTPDPGVIEINQAPAASALELLEANRALFASATNADLAPYRLHYNGELDDSGGGGQLSIGGPSPEESPFVAEPHLLPRLVRYLNHHPALSYWFAPVYVGAFSQAPRPDEGICDLFRELEVTLERIATQPAPDPEFLWRSLNPFLRDVSGNAHRSELNIEKFWSPAPRPDGIAGVVEFRAFRMARTPESLAALAALVRSVIAMLMAQPFDQPLVYWADQLHDRFSLPFCIEQDLDSVLGDLEDTGFGLAPAITDLLRYDSGREITSMRCGEHCLRLVSALEFWPQVGDTVNQPSDSRIVDASTGRLEIRIQGSGVEHLEDWELAVNGYSVPMRLERGEDGPVRLVGIRYRRFSNAHALHPDVEPALPIRFQLYNRNSGRLMEASYFEWRPDGGAYEGLPADLGEAERRRNERFVCRHRHTTSPPPTRNPTPYALTEYCFDLRRA